MRVVRALSHFPPKREGYSLIKLSAEHAQNRPLIERAFSEWVPSASVELSLITPGHSGSSLFTADLRGTKSSVIPSGQYIFKLSAPAPWADQEDEITAHRRSYNWNVAFSQHHIPKLIAHYPSGAASLSTDGYAMLFEIAGGSLDRFSPTDTRQNSLFYASSDQILSSILRAWSNADVEADNTPDQFLTQLCGYRLEKEKAQSLHKLLAELFGDALHFVVSGDVLINPLRFVDLVRDRKCAASSIVEGLIHGDLHGGNILAHRMQPTEHPFWIIDFALSRKGPIGYDAAYLELSHALTALGDEHPALLVGALRSAEDPGDRNPLPDGAWWTRELILKMRRALDAWRDDQYPYRIDETDRQLALCRVAAGINWANKPIKKSWQKAALCYAGWAARQYLKAHQPEIWNQVGLSHEGKGDLPVVSGADETLWTELWQATNGFSTTAGKFILVAERLDSGPALRALGQLPWSAVIDLDPASDQSGLYRHAGPLLAARRGVHVFTSVIPTVDLRRGTGWMMASGWAAKSEYFPDYNEWRWERVPIIREFVRTIAEATNPEPVHVIILPGATLDPAAPMARLTSIVAVIQEASRGRALIHLLGNRIVSETAKGLSPIPLETEQFVSFVADTFGTTFSSDVAEVPGPNGEKRTISPEALRTMQENLYVLHSSILGEQVDTVESESEFWRGRPPTWAELHDSLDIERDIHRNLIRTLSEKLDAHRNQTVVLDHSPGAGGTTAALRAAWDLKSRYPVAVLHKNSVALAHRVRELFHISERPVLLVAESADLTESAREELYRYFSQNNCRVVLLYLRRTLGQSDDETTSLIGPMKKHEAASFLKIYSTLTTDHDRLEQLKQITYQANRERYRLPFFYGLLTFEREFLSIERYVESHLGQVRKAPRDMLEYLALVTIYSNSGISMSLLRAMMGADPGSPLTLEELLGAGPARLLIPRNGDVRFMHQIIAEQVFAHFHGGGPIDDWRLDLKAYATDFIRDAVAAAEPEALRALFRQMFVDRLGGVDGTEDKEDFAPIIETLDAIDKTLGHAVLEVLAEKCPQESHFWSHLGRHQIYRLRRDYEKAEEYLLRAIAISPQDPLHHHTFGLVLRSRLRHKLQAVPRGADLQKVFSEIDPFFTRAVAEFEETRRLSPDNVYGYITHIQLVLAAARRLKEAAGADTIARVGAEYPPINSWLHENLAAAEHLLREASYLYGTLEQSNQYLTECEADLDKLYGDLNSVVEIWEIVNASGKGGPFGRRALANAYLARNDRRWSGLDLAELRRVIDLMENNLRDPGRKDDDYQLWFNAFIMLPEFSVDSALSRLALWAKRFPSWRAYYYIYVLNFVLWYMRRSDDVGPFERALEECKQRHVGRRNTSSLWYGTSPGGSGLVSEVDLGGWNRESNFFAKPETLTRVNGVVEAINGPQAGSILIDGHVRAFFVPGKAFSSHRDENALVNFYLGFSPIGLRAWSVEVGHVRGGERAPQIVVPVGSEGVVVHVPAIEESEKEARTNTLRQERIMRFANELVMAKAKIGAKLTMAELGERLDAVFGMGGTTTQLGIDDLSEALSNAGKFEIRSDGSERLIMPKEAIGESEAGEDTASGIRALGQVIKYDSRRNFGFIHGQDAKEYFFHRDFVLPAYRKKVSRPGPIVLFVAAEGERGPVANGITVLEDAVLTKGGLLPNEQLGAAVSEFVVAELGGIAAGGLPLSELLARVTAAFRSDVPLESKLDAKTLGAFVSRIEGVMIGGKPRLNVKLSEELAFGRLPTSRAKRAVPGRQKSPVEPPSHGTSSTIPDLREVRDRALAAVREAEARGKPISMVGLGTVLSHTFPGKKKVIHLLGYRSLTAFLLDIAELRVDSSGAGEVRLTDLDQLRES